ncbi:3-deoxy-manno-octulosonate cytidylyltransferase (CMP-KDO synthetase) [Lishizhenia tianjinensis]|uniref:3-deoxy-manno-octulosonate cytidylyltransferase n=1 Tax=Lishizhenia tianjinensis TaxID=477690 RepID=A0A1I7BDJ0_9FLAO|nr:3-deoxy-manno-octulosonate cytidylyltransferase [Lishizhenia tianjinensis]SFT85263.1 3-deoxy-manno-octulosonate cytidylyltransferase (CMP-KDO synthetase) [Lishizhenia tianjinensis]
MKVLGVIPSRYGSSRFPGKPLIDIKGKSMIQRVYEGAKQSSLLDELVVATDDQRIVDEVEAFGGKVMLTAAHHPSGTDRCAEVAEQYADYDVVINIQGDEPLVNPKQLDALLAVFKDSKVEIATLATRNISEEDVQNPNRIKLVCNAEQEALYFSRSAIPNQHHAKQSALENFPFFKHIGLYAYKTEVLMKLTQLEPSLLEQVESLEQLRWMYYGYKIKVVETDLETPNIDTPDDLEKVLQFLED